jgi:four helix bundle protein
MTQLSERFQEWETSPPSDLFGDPIWRLPAYRIALFLSDIVREDVLVMVRERAPAHLHSQLARAVGSIGSNIEEGYARFSGKERARYYEIALGSAREARHWYRGTQTWLGRSAAEERGALLTRAIKILTVAIPRERQGESEQRLQRSRSKAKERLPAPSTSTSTSTSTKD